MAQRKTYEVIRTRAANNDLDALFDFLVGSYVHFGDSIDSAFARAEVRVERVKADLRALGKRPKQGTLRPNMMPGMRSVTKVRAVFYFTWMTTSGWCACWRFSSVARIISARC